MTEKEFAKIQKKTWVAFQYQLTTKGPVYHAYMLLSDVSKEGKNYNVTKYMTIRKIKTGMRADERLIFYKTPRIEILDEFWYKKMQVLKYVPVKTLDRIFRTIFTKRVTVS